MKPLISILIPCHNISKIDKFSLNSVLKNEYDNLEILLLNDYSSDNTLEILKKYQEKDSRIRIINLKDRHEHVGLGFNRHFLIEHCRGDYFIFLDDDDSIKKNTIKTFVKELNKYPDSEVISCNYKITYPLFFNIRTRISRLPKKYKVDLQDPIEQFINMPIFAWSHLIKKSFYMEIVNKTNKKFDLHIYEDQRYMYNIFLHINKYRYIPKILFNYRLRKNSLSTNINNIFKNISHSIKSYEVCLDGTIELKKISNEKLQTLKETILFQLKLLLYGRLTFIPKKEKEEVKKFMINKMEELISKYDLPEPKRLKLFSALVYSVVSQKFPSKNK